MLGLGASYIWDFTVYKKWKWNQDITRKSTTMNDPVIWICPIHIGAYTQTEASAWSWPNSLWGQWFSYNTMRPRQNGHRFADDTFKRIFFDENVRIPIEISLKFDPKGPINNIPALVQIMAWRRSGDKNTTTKTNKICASLVISVANPQMPYQMSKSSGNKLYSANLC